MGRSQEQANKRKGKELASEIQEENEDELEELLGNERIRINNDDVEEIKRFYSKQLSKTRSSYSTVVESITKDELDALVRSVMRHMLFKSYKQQCAPIAKADLTGVVSQKYKDLSRRGLQTYVIACAQVKFVEIFGLEMKELVKTQKLKTRQKHRKLMDASERSQTKLMVLRSLIPPKTFVELVQRHLDPVENAFHQVVVTLISLNGGQCHERALWKYLGKIGVRKGDRDHPALGDVDSLFNHMLKLRYLQSEKVTDDEGEGYVYEIAENGQDLLPKRNILSFVETMADGG